jgi:azurin
MRTFTLLMLVAGLAYGVPPIGDTGSSSLAPRTVTLTATDQMRFSVATFSVKPGELIRVVLRAVGTQPADRMSHNFILLKSTTDVPRFIMMASLARQDEYFPRALKDEVIAATTLVSGGQTTSVTFKAPVRTGEYPYVCSFPGHYNSGMQGSIIVRR